MHEPATDICGRGYRHPNRPKDDKDPALWLPTAESAHCRYVTEWTSTKLRWKLSIDPAEANTLQALAASRPGAIVE